MSERDLNPSATKALPGSQTGALGPGGRPGQATLGGRYETVQFLRFLAAFMVVLVHATFYTHERLDPGTPLYSEGANGVRLFFVISGFVMIVSSRRLMDTATGWRVFAVKRLARIVPIYWAITLLKLAILLTTPAVVLHAELDWAYIAKSFVFYPARNVDGEIAPLLGVGWTLNFEMFFYALFAATLLLRLRPLVFLGPVLGGLAILSLFRSDTWPVPLQFYCSPIILDFLAGMIIAERVSGGRLPGVKAGWLMAAAGLIWLFAPLPLTSGGSGIGSFGISLGRTIASSLILVGALALEARHGKAIPRFALFMGAASYSLYLVHPIVAPAVPQVFARIGLDLPLLAIALSITAAMVAATIAYKLIEAPAGAAMDRIAGMRGLLDPGPARARSASPHAGGEVRSDLGDETR